MASSNLNATADILSECIIHKILYCLSYEDASPMRFLSKTWLQAWLTLPNLSFKAKYDFESTAKIVDAIMERYRDDKIPIDKFEFSNCSRSNQFFAQINKWLDIALQNGIKEIVGRGPHRFTQKYPFPVFEVLAAKSSLRVLVLIGWDMMHVPLLSSSGAMNCCHSLTKLTLSCLSLRENMLQTLLNSCPSIVEFILQWCQGLKKIEILNLQKIKSISIKSIGKERVKIRAPTLEHLYYSDCYEFDLEKLDDVECHNLKALELKYATISYRVLYKLISTSQSLKVLKIHNCKGLRDVLPSNLKSFGYIGDQIPQFQKAIEALKNRS